MAQASNMKQATLSQEGELKVAILRLRRRALNNEALRFHYIEKLTEEAEQILIVGSYLSQKNSQMKVLFSKRGAGALTSGHSTECTTFESASVQATMYLLRKFLVFDIQEEDLNSLQAFVFKMSKNCENKWVIEPSDNNKALDKFAARFKSLLEFKNVSPTACPKFDVEKFKESYNPNNIDPNRPDPPRPYRKLFNRLQLHQAK